MADFDASGVLASIEFGADLQTLACRYVGDLVDDDFVTHQRAALPILGDEREHPMPNLVLLAGSRREVAHVNRQSEAGRQGLQSDLPQAAPACVFVTSLPR